MTNSNEYEKTIKNQIAQSLHEEDISSFLQLAYRLILQRVSIAKPSRQPSRCH